MDRWLIALNVPFFFLLIGVEWLVARRRGLTVHRFQDGVASLSTGILQQVGDLAIGLWAVASYAFVHEHLRIMELSMEEPWHWVLAALGVDFLYYWFHRASHRVNLLWAAHVVHHHSEDYNLTTALRQSTLQPAFNAIFFWPLAVLGVPPLIAVLLFTLDVLYQFWIHTRLLPSLGPLEYVLCTPSNHRVHHGIDPEYLDRNYGGVLIVWDRLFGTYQAELHEPTFGTVTPLRSWNPLWANVAYFGEIARRARAADGLQERVWAWLAPPEWRPRALGGPITPGPVPADRTKYAPAAAPRVHAYVAVQYLWLVSVMLVLTVDGRAAPWAQLVAVGAWIVASVTAWAGLFERRRWARAVETIRLISTFGLAPWLLPAEHWPLVAGHCLLAAVMLAWLGRLGREVLSGSRPRAQPDASGARAHPSAARGGPGA